MLSRILVALAIVLAAILYFRATRWINDRARESSVTALSHDATGLSIFHAFLNENRGGSVELQRRPFLRLEELKKYRTIAVLWPLAPLSAHEASLLGDYVRSGGTLLLSFDDEASWGGFARVLANLGIHEKVGADPSFQNFQVAPVSPVAAFLPRSSWFSPGETYALYGRMVFQRAECIASRFACFVLERKVGQGKVVLISGLPPFANALIGLGGPAGGNGRLAERMLETATPLLLDEYHHFFSEHSFREVVQRPEVSLWLSVILALTVLCLAFARTDFHERSLVAARPAGGERSYHAVNQAILLRLLEEPASLGHALNANAKFLARLYPSRRAEIESIITGNAGEDPLARAMALIRLHQACLKEKGAKPPL